MTEKAAACTNPNPCSTCSDPAKADEIKAWLKQYPDEECPLRRWDSPDCPCDKKS